MARRAARALAIGLGVFTVLQIALAVWIERGPAELRDPLYGYRLNMLRQRMAEKTGRPLALILGSSRAECGIRTDLLNHDRGPLFFNFGLPREGYPICELLTLDRLLRAGVRPAHVFAEILTPVMRNGSPNEQFFPPEQLDRADLEFLGPHLTTASAVARPWAIARLTPIYWQRLFLLARYAPDWTTPVIRGEMRLNATDFGWSEFQASRSPEARQRATEHAHWSYRGAFVDPKISARAERSVRALCERCRVERIPLTLFVMPEDARFRSWYCAAGNESFRQLLASLASDYQVSVVDMREWVADERKFIDGHHLYVEGANELTQRFGSAVVEQLTVDQQSAAPTLISRLPPTVLK
jgi:hypothetical protein